METIFVKTLGNSPQIKVLDFLISFHSFDYSLTEISKNTKVSYSTLKYLMPKMLKRNLVLIKRKIGKANLYSLNLKNEAIKYLMAFDWKLTKQEIKELK